MNLDYVSKIKFGLKRYKTIATDKATSRVLDGSYNSIYKGRSMNFDELREYVPGDDIKDIDWKATSRSQKVLIRQYIAEKRHNIMLVMDANRRMLASTKTGEDKGEVALMAGGTLGYMVTDNGDYVSGLYYHDDKMERSPFKTGFLNLEFLLEGYAKCLTPTNKSEQMVKNNYQALLYVPARAPFDYYTKEYKKGLQLYTSGVLIMENCSFTLISAQLSAFALKRSA